jgi:hypothetical protein
MTGRSYGGRCEAGHRHCEDKETKNVGFLYFVGIIYLTRFNCGLQGPSNNEASERQSAEQGAGQRRQ